MIRTESEDEGVRVSIQNFGSFIPLVTRAQIFETFYTSEKKGGTGLGLAIAKKWVEAHDGEISCESQKGDERSQGWVSFSFSIPGTRPRACVVTSPSFDRID